MTTDHDLDIRVRVRSLDALRGMLDALALNTLDRGLRSLPSVYIPTRDDFAPQAEGSYPTPAGEGSEASDGEVVHAPPSPTPKRKRGRPSTKPEPAPLPETEVTDDTLARDPLPQTTPFPPELDDALGLGGLAPAAPTGDFLAELGLDMAPADKLQRARQMLLDLLKAEPGRKPEADALMAKYGVKTLGEIPTSKANELLADAILITNSQPGGAENA